jgi:hypothetical protein
MFHTTRADLAPVGEPLSLSFTPTTFGTPTTVTITQFPALMARRRHRGRCCSSPQARFPRWMAGQLDALRLPESASISYLTSQARLAPTSAWTVHQPRYTYSHLGLCRLGRWLTVGGEAVIGLTAIGIGDDRVRKIE